MSEANKDQARREELRTRFAGKDDKILKEEQGRIYGEMRSLTEEVEKREGDSAGRMTGDETQKWEALNAEFDAMDQEIGFRADERKLSSDHTARQERMRELEGKMHKPTEHRSGSDFVNRGSAKPLPENLKEFDAETRKLRNAFWAKYLSNRQAEIQPHESRAMQQDVSNIGGSLTPDTAFFNEVIMFARDAHIVRGLARVIPMPRGYNALDVPSWDTDAQNMVWGSEVGSYAEDSSIRTGKRRLIPHPATLLVKVSKTLANNPLVNVESEVARSIAWSSGETSDTAYLTGSGANQPLGLYTASDSGISTSRDVSTGNTTTSIQADGLINALYSLKEKYIGASTFLFHRDGVKQIRTLKDGTGRYLWRLEGFANGVGPTILDRPYRMSENAPNTFTTGQYVGLVGDFQFYWIAERMPFELETLRELYATTNQIGIIARMEIDGMPVLGEAFARVKLA